MKKFIFVVFFLIFLFAFCNICYAAGQKIQIQELDLTLKIPENYIVITQNTSTNGTEANEVKEYGLSISDIQYSMIASNLYLDALEMSGMNEITINSVILEYETPELKNLDIQQKEYLIEYITDMLAPENLNDMVNEYAEENPDAFLLENIHAEYIGEEMIGELLYMIFDITGEQNGIKTYSKYYYTITRNQGIGIKLLSYNGSLTDSQNEILYSVVSSMNFLTPESSVIIQSQDLETGSTNLGDFGYKVLVAVIVAGILNLIFLPISIMNKKKKLNAVNTNLKSENEEKKNMDKKLFCTKCGKLIPIESEYCRYCGNKVSKL